MLGLAPDGVYRAGHRHRGRGGLLPHRFTLACGLLRAPSAVCFLWHFPWGRPHWPLASILLCGARTFLSRRSPKRTAAAAAFRAPRSSDLLSSYAARRMHSRYLGSRLSSSADRQGNRILDSNRATDGGGGSPGPPATMALGHEAGSQLPSMAHIRECGSLARTGGLNCQQRGRGLPCGFPGVIASLAFGAGYSLPCRRP